MSTATIQGFRLSPQQLNLWLAQPADTDSPYLVQCSVNVEGDLDSRRLARAVEAAVGRHEILRTAFRRRPSMNVPLQVIADEQAVPVAVHDVSHLSPEERERGLKEISGRDRRHRFDYEQGPLLRVSLLKFSAHKHLLLLTLSALCGDLPSLRNLVADISRLYETNGDAGGADEVIQYADCAEILNELIESEEATPGRDYWRGKLDGAPLSLTLPLEGEGRSGADFSPSVFSASVGPAIARELEARASAQGVSVDVLLLACWQSLLARLTGVAQVTVGVAFDGRTDKHLEEALGLFTKYLPVSGVVSDQLQFTALVNRIDEELRGMAEWQDYFAGGREEMPGGEAPFFPFCFRFDDPGAKHFCRDLTLTTVEEYECLGHCKVKLTCTRKGESLVAEFQYDSALYGREDIARLSEQYRALLAGAARTPEALLGELDVLGEEERRRVLVEFNDTTVEFRQERLLHGLFEAQTARTPGRIALLFEDEQLTYAELNASANRLAHHLRALGVGPEVPVAICLERSVGMVVALLAVLKAGGGYVPLDPSYPKERLSFTLEDARAPVLLTTERLRKGLPAHDARVVSLDADREAIAAQSAENPAGFGLTPDNLAYVIYTSGSTGKPKGVLIPHRAVCNHMLWMQTTLPLTEEDRVLQKTPFTFDASISEFFLPLLSGAQLVVAAPGGHQDSSYLVQTVIERGVTILQLVPSMLRPVLEEKDIAGCHSLRAVVCGGETLPADLQERFFGLLGAELHNLYGPTEASIDVTHWLCRPGDNGTGVIIGRPLSNTQIYILNGQLRPSPVGVAGELHIGGDNLARGYMGRPELTAEKFIPDPFSSKPGARLYRTGDLARYLSDGRLEFFGRLDHQVKVRGFRIELGEIEAALAQHEGVRDCVVLAREDNPGDVRLTAYVVHTREGGGADGGELRSHLQGKLPEYMVPAFFVFLERLPLMHNGKLDRGALPAPEAAQAGSEYVAPRTPVEEVVAGIWSEVLRASRVGVNDNFFSLGGHSLLATQVVSRVRDAFAVELPLRNFFEALTLAELAESIEAEMKSARRIEFPPLTPVPRGAGLPLSSAQQRLWFLDQLEPGNAFYVIPTAVRLSGQLNVAALGETFGEIVRRHESLRTTFAAPDGQPVQIISEAFDPPLYVSDLSAEPEPRREAEALRLVREEALRPFDLERGPLMRLLLLRLDDEDHILLCTMHHIVSDIWSRAVLIREVTELYSAISRGEQASLPALPIQYADYAYWERELLQGKTLEAEIAYWKERLAGAPPVLSLPTDHPRPLAQSLRGAREGVALPPELLEKCRALSRREGTTMFMTLLAAFNVLLLRYTGQEDIVVGTPAANRDRLEIENLIGFFANTLVLRTDLSGGPTFRDLLRRVREAALDAYVHSELPFETLVGELQPERNLGHTPVFQVMFIHQLAPREALELPGLTLERLDAGTETSKYDLSLYIVERPESWSAWVEYSTDLFEAATMKRLLGHLRRVLDSVVEGAERGVWDLPLLTTPERQLLAEWNNTRANYPRDKCIHQLFEEQAARTPSAVAFISGDGQMTYRELNRRANQLARYLLRHGAHTETLVGVCMNRSFEMVVGLLGVLKAGGAFVPLDPSYPRERLAYMVEDSGLSMALTESRFADVLPPAGTEFRRVCLDAEWEAVAEESGDNLDVAVAQDQLAYLIYTSGSTGRPKGVFCLHGGAVNRFQWMWERFPFTADEVCCQKTSLNFVDSVWEIFGPLLRGTPTAILQAETLLDAEQLVESLEGYGVTRIVLVPSLLRHLLEVGLDLGTRLQRLKLCVSSGEALPMGLARSFRESLPGCTLLNLYGSSEVSADSLAHVVRDSESWASVPLGNPIANTDIFILDPLGQPVPVGVAGEIHVGGDGLGRGYLNRPELTAEKFIPHPFGGVGGARLYRTGDLGRFLPDGSVEFLGRADHQVKVHGRRIELGEVEAALLSHAAVHATVVLLAEREGDKRLVAYVVPRGGQVLPRKELRQHLKAQLPEHMVPSEFVMLGEMPLLPNGKVNRRALRAPDRASQETEEDYVAPRTPVEEVLAGIWAEVLGAARVGMTDNFFELGGQSLLLTRVTSRVRDAFGVNPPLRLLFEEPTAEGLARAIEAAMRAEQGVLPPPIGRAPRHAPLPLSFMQERVWHMAQREGRPSVYNLEVRLEGVLSVPALELSLNEVVRRNEVLRTTFTSFQGRLSQVIHPHEPFGLPLVDLGDLPEAERRARADQLSAEQGREPFALSRRPLLRFTLLRLAEESHLLLFTIPHIICDHESVELFAGEVAAAYAAISEGRPSPLPEIAIQYPDFAYWERQWLQGDVYETQLSYWRRQLEGCPPVMQLLTDHARPPVRTYLGARQPVAFEANLAEAVASLARRKKCTVFMTLLAAFKALLYRHTGQRDMVVGTAIAGRSHPGIEKLIGNFSHALPLRTRPSDDITFGELLGQVREALLEAYAHEDVPFDRIVEELKLEHDPGYPPLIQVGFVVHMAQPSPESPGDLDMTVASPHSGRSVYDLTVRLYHTPGGIVGNFEYNTDLFEPATISRMVEHYRALLAVAVADPELRLAELPPPTKAERQQPSAGRVARG
jgi:amino acid adenylation domain-containing protein